MTHSGTPLVLLVDDDPTSLLLLEKHLAGAGYRLVTASGGKEALQVAMREGPAIIITDWMMPDPKGIELCRMIRADSAFGTPFIILVTAHSAPELMTEAFEAGVDDFLLKPINRRELLARLRGAARITSLQKDLEHRRLEVHRANAQIQLSADQLAEANCRLRTLASTDELTGLINRREALARLTDAWSLARRHRESLSCIMVDVDHFKRINDTHGHNAGDQVLAQTAKILKRSARAGEVVARLGGEEFLIICPKASEPQATVAAERFRSQVADHRFTFGDAEASVTISLGVAELRADFHRAEDLLKASDEAMYAAKEGGRNQVRCAVEPDEPSDAVAMQSITTSALQPPSSEPCCPQPGPSGPDATIQILVIDGCADRRAQWSRMLTGRGFEVIESASVAEAATPLRSHQVGAVFLGGASSPSPTLEWNKLIEDEGLGGGIPVMYIPSQMDGEPADGESDGSAETAQAEGCGSGEELALSAMHHISETLAQIGLGADHEQRSEQNRTMALLVDFSRQLIGARNLGEVIERTVSVATELTTSMEAALLMPDAQGEHLTVAGAVGFDEATLAHVRLPIRDEGAGEMLRSRDPVLINSSDDVEQRGHLLGDDHPTVPPAIVAPLRVAEHLVGVLHVARRFERRPYTVFDQEYLDLFCNLAASAIEDHVVREACDVARDSIVSALAALAETRDNDTGKHLERVSAYCAILARELRADPDWAREITDEFLADLARAVPLHDIGKVAVPDRILLKPGRLTDEERVIMQRHTTLGADTIHSVVERAPGVTFLEMAECIARSHHERFNGEGYPSGLSGSTIPRAARIVSVADVYDAITSRRVYKSAMSHENAAVFIKDASGTQFDPVVVEAFGRHEEEFRRLSAELADADRRPTHAGAETRAWAEAQAVAAPCSVACSD